MAEAVPGRVAVNETVGTSVGRGVAAFVRVPVGGGRVEVAGGRVTTITTVKGGSVSVGVAV